MQELIRAVREKNAILFAGAGLSMNLGLPSFKQLIGKLADDLKFDPDLFYLSGDYLTLAEYYCLQKGSLGPLRSWMDTTWHDSRIDIRQSKIHKAIVNLRFPLIYTTNYDRWIEKAFEAEGVRYAKIANVADIARTNGAPTQIVKLHGDFDDDSSIVLTESSYFDRLSFESPLDIKLRSDVLGRTILFIGYSLTDVNIRYLLYKLHRQWQSSTYEHARPRSYIFLSRPNVVQEEVLRSRGLEPIISIHDDPTQGLEAFLKELLNSAFGQVNGDSCT
jgi:hypothetical protein